MWSNYYHSSQIDPVKAEKFAEMARLSPWMLAERWTNLTKIRLCPKLINHSCHSQFYPLSTGRMYPSYFGFLSRSVLCHRCHLLIGTFTGHWSCSCKTPPRLRPRLRTGFSALLIALPGLGLC